MNPSPETSRTVTQSAPVDRKHNAIPPHNPSLPLLLGGILLGVVGTALLLPRFRPTPAATPQSAPAEAGKEAAGNEGHGPIHLSDEVAKTAGIRVEPARLAPISEGLTVPGTVELSSNRSAKITPTAPGKVARLLVKLGETVRVGQPLVILDSYEVAQARAAVRQAESNVQQARAGIQTAKAEVDQAKASVQQARADVDQTLTRQAGTEIALQRQRDLASAGAFSQAPLLTAQSEGYAAQSDLLKEQTELQAHTVIVQRAERLFKEELISRAELEQTQLDQRQDEARAQQAQTRVGLAKQTLEREQKVFSGDLLSKQATQTAEAEVRAAQGDVHKGRQGLLRARQDVRRAQSGEQAARTMHQGAVGGVSAARTNLYALEGSGRVEGGGLVTISAPIGGVVTERTATVGEAVERTTSLLVIENLNTVTINANVPEQDVARVRIGLPAEATVAAYPKQRFAGTVQSIAGRVDEKTRALTVRCLVENRNGLLRPQMFAQVTLGAATQRVPGTSALTVPMTALEEDGEKRFVYVEESEGKYERRKVQVGRTTKTMAEIKGGLKAGERVVTDGVFILKSEANKSQLKEQE